MKTMRVTLEIDVDNLSPEKLAECAKDMEMSVADLEGLANANAPEIARTLENFGGDMNDELFAGSDLFVQFADVRVLTAEWVSIVNTRSIS